MFVCLFVLYCLQVSQTGLRMGMRGSRGRGGRNQIVIPAQGIVDIRNAVTEFLDEYGSDEGQLHFQLKPVAS